MSNEKLYKEELMDHFKYPRNKKKIENSDFSSAPQNTSCGDKITIEGKIEKDENGIERIVDLGFAGSGCVISQASSSMLIEKCIGRTVDEVLAMNKDDVLKLIGIELGPTRLRCALLSLEGIKEALHEYQNKK